MKKQWKKKSSAALALAVSAAILAQGANAAALGNIIAYSYLNEPLSVVVTIEKLGAGDEQTLSARIVSAEAYAAAGVKRPDWADQAQVRVKSLGAGRYGVEITTSAPVSDPASSILLELKAKSGDATREYALLLDIKSEGMKDPLKAEAIASAPISAKEFERKAAEASAPAAGKGAQAPQERETVRVRQGSALSIIANATARPGVTHEQMMLGYLRQNPGAFQGGNINRLKSGVILRVPSAEQAREVDAAKARAQVAQMASAYAAWRNEALGSRLPAASERQAGSAASGAVEKERAAPAAGPDELRLGKAEKGGAGGPSREDMLAKQKELEEEQSRSRDLQRAAEDLRKLLAIKDAELAKLRGAPAKPAEKAPEAAQEKPVDASAVSKEAAAAAGSAPSPAALEAQAPGSGELIRAEGEAQATPEAAPAPTPAPEAAKPAPKPAVVIPAEPEPEPGFMEQHGQSAMLGGGLLAALLAALGVSRLRRKRKERDSGSVTIASEPSTGPSTAEQEAGALERDPVQEHLEAADTFLSYQQDEKAFGELAAALAISPKHPEALIRMARLAAKAQDREAFTRAYEDLRSGPAYSAHQRELFQLRSQLPKEEPAQDISQGLESFVESQERERAQEPSVVDEVFGRPRSERSEAPMAPAPAAEQSEERFDAVDSRFLTPMTPFEPERRDQGESAPLEFESISFDLDVPEDRPAERSEPLLEIPSQEQLKPVEIEPISMEAPAPKESSSEVKTMLDLALAYMEMGDKEGARELLVEVRKADQGALGEQAEELLSKL